MHKALWESEPREPWCFLLELLKVQEGKRKLNDDQKYILGVY